MTPIRFTSGERLAFRARDCVTVSEWAARHRAVAKGPAQGLWSNELTPYLVQPMDDFTRPYVRKIMMCFAPQTGKTQAALNCLLWAIDQAPGPAMYIMPDEAVAKRISRRQILPTFRASDRVSALMSDRKNETSTLAVTFRNGADLMMAWATSPAAVASESVRYLFFDEPGKYPEFSGKEADPFTLGEMRTNAFPFTKKIMYFSTPNEDGDPFSRAWASDVDVHYAYHVPCPICGHEQAMLFDNITWPSGADPREIQRRKLARYTCAQCGMEWDDATKNAAVRRGRWVPSSDMARPSCTGYHLPSWYSPFVSLSDAAAAFRRGLNDYGKMMAFVTQHKAEFWRSTIESKSESQILAHRCQLPPGIVPPEAVALTAGIDVQQVGFWFVVRAWAEDLSSWLISYGYLSGWEDVEALLFKTTFPRHGNPEDRLPIWRAAIDTGGGASAAGEWSRTEEVYSWLRLRSQRIGWGIKGASRPQLRRITPRVIDRMASGKAIPGGLELRLLDTVALKDILHWRMSRKLGEDQRWYLHSETGVDYARQILAEERRRDRRGKSEWRQIRGDNHLLDAEVYAAAAADNEWAPSLQMLARYHAQQQQATPPPPPGQEPAPKPATVRTRW